MRVENWKIGLLLPYRAVRVAILNVAAFVKVTDVIQCDRPVDVAQLADLSASVQWLPSRWNLVIVSPIGVVVQIVLDVWVWVRQLRQVGTVTVSRTLRTVTMTTSLTRAKFRTPPTGPFSLPAN